ncbi:MAG: TerC family protein [Deltaproteobacteria bacterium]|nr:TerC family protein [Deltaproteobacteria bacterium]
MIESLSQPASWIALLTLTAMEVVLGIDNIIFITILVGRLPEKSRAWVRQVGIGLALISRLGLMFTLSAMMKLTAPLFRMPIAEHDVTGRDLILLGGGLFLIAKASHEIYAKVEAAPEEEKSKASAAANVASILVQILLLDIVFSLDSVITAVGMAQELWIMVTAMIVAVLVMLVSAGGIGSFVERHPSMKILALSFLLLIGVLLFADGLGQHIPKGYVYFAMAFSVLIELLNMRLRKKAPAPVHLHSRFEEEKKSEGWKPPRTTA